MQELHAITTWNKLGVKQLISSAIRKLQNTRLCPLKVNGSKLSYFLLARYLRDDFLLSVV